MIVGTAGHIDHGKTTLVQALTGIDTDRLPEEKARGMSIELGYAFLDVPGSDERIGFIDVPGHERFVPTMLAGATGIDFALVLVAADDGVMPQTREHVAVLALLGVSAGVVVLTKADRVDPARIASVTAEVALLLAGTTLAEVPVVAVSARTGDGIEPLRERLYETARRRAAEASGAAPAGRDDAPAAAAFRLAIDRAFTLVGVGTVVTGTVHAGRVNVGDELAITPSPRSLQARVRSLHAQNRLVGHADAGQRCAVALAGIARDEVERGQWLVAPSAVVATDRLDATLSLWQEESRPLRSGTVVQVHLGTGDVCGTVAILRVDDADVAGGDALPPGASAQVQLVLRRPIAAWHGDRLVLRDASASRTLGGGSVLDPFAPGRYRRTPQRLGALAAWALPDATGRLAALVDASPTGISLSRWLRAEGRPAATRPPLPSGSLRVDDAGRDDWALGARHAAAIGIATVAALEAFHQRDPEILGPDAARLRRLVAPRLPDALWRGLLADLQRQARIAVRGAWVHLPAHGLRLSDADRRLAQKVVPLLATAGFEGSWARDLARATNEGEPLMRTTLARLAQRGELHQVVKDLYYPPPTVGRLAEHARSLAELEGGAVTAASFRDATGLGRKRAIQILEYFDRIGFLRRVGDAHRLRKDTALFFDEAERQ